MLRSGSNNFSIKKHELSTMVMVETWSGSKDRFEKGFDQANYLYCDTFKI